MAIHGARAATISLSPVTPSVSVGQSVLIDVNFDFSTDPTVGGGVDVFFDASRLSFVSYTPNGSLGDDPGLRRSPDALAGELNGIGFGNFGGIAGPGTVGQLSFIATAAGSAALTLQINDNPVGDFFSAGTFSQQSVSLSGAAVQIAVVPVPAAGILLTSALAMFSISTRRRAV